jgi:hypothetical protein
MLLALAVGGTLMAVVAWQVGELLGSGPTEAELADVGAVVTTALKLGSTAALAAAPFLALFAYLAGAVYVAYDDLGRTGSVESPRPDADGALPAPPGEKPATVS